MSEDVRTRRRPDGARVPDDERHSPDDELAILMGIPDDREWEVPRWTIALGALVGGFLLVAAWATFGRGADDGEESAPLQRDEPVEVLGTIEPTVTTIAPLTTSGLLVAVSDMTGRPVSQARFALELSGMTVTVTEVVDPSASPGVVIAQEPPAGDTPPGSAITLTVAVAPAPECNDVDGQIPPTTFLDVVVSGSPTDAIAVGWAEHVGIMSGVQPGVFGVDVPLSRAALVTMLHRYFCEPTPSASSSFTDVAASDFYADAAAWATAEGIVSGTDGGAFDPASATTRAQWVTVLWRALGEPPGEDDLVFTDVVPGAYYEPALRWAVTNNLVAGTTPSTFSPEAPLSRLDATALLYLLESTVDPNVT